MWSDFRFLLSKIEVLVRYLYSKSLHMFILIEVTACCKYRRPYSYRSKEKSGHSTFKSCRWFVFVLFGVWDRGAVTGHLVYERVSTMTTLFTLKCYGRVFIAWNWRSQCTLDGQWRTDWISVKCIYFVSFAEANATCCPSDLKQQECSVLISSSGMFLG